MKRLLHIDIETYSSVDLADCGVYKYAESPDFEVLLFSYAFDSDEVRCVDLAQGEKIPPEVVDALTDPDVVKLAHNATFERVCLSRHLGLDGFLPPEQWECTMILAGRCGLPFSLEKVGEALGLEKEELKMKEGKALIRYFSVPCRPTKANGGRTRNLPRHAPERWDLYKLYNIRDVVTEMAIHRRLLAMLPDIPAWERELQTLDGIINDRGVLIDRTMVENAVRMDYENTEHLMDEQTEATGLDNPTSLTQLKGWIGKQTGVPVATLTKNNIPDMIRKFGKFYPKVATVLSRHLALSKTSTSKYPKMLTCACKDDRVRGILQFYGAARTGRWAGRLVQVQNLPQNHMPDLNLARDIVREGDLDLLEAMYENVPGVLSELIRTSFIAPKRQRYIVCDFSAIEARVIAWLAGEEWAVEAFRHGKDIYCETAGKMYHCKVEKHGENSHLRQKGKIAVLALGYQGGVGALKAMGGERSGWTEEEMKGIVRDWRNANPAIVKLWANIEKAVDMALEQPHRNPRLAHGLRFKMTPEGLRVTLPSDRSIFYPGFRHADRGRYEYEGQNQVTRQWETIETYGGKMSENIVQATARDLIGNTILNLEKAGFRVVFHIHDETVIEAPFNQTLADVERIFSEGPEWAEGLPLKGAGYETPYYLKD